MSAQPQKLGSHIVETLALAAPVILGQLGQIAINQSDTVMVGELGSTELAAASLAGGLWILVAVVGMGIFVAISPVTAQALGAGKSHATFSSILHQGVLLSVYIGLAIVGLLLGMAELMPYLGQKPEVVALSQPYMRIIAVSALPMFVFLAFRHFIEGFEKTLPGMVILAIMVVLNIFLNWILIYGTVFFDGMGLIGAGYATLLARISGMVMIFLYLRFNRRFWEYWPKRGLGRHQWPVMKDILRIGLPSGMQYFFEVGAFSGAVILAGWIGEDALSAHQIAIGVASVTFMFYLGFSAAASIRVGNALGREDYIAVRRAGVAALLCSAACILVFVLVMVIFRNALPWLYIDDLDVVQLTIPLLVIAAIFQVFDGIQAVGVGILRGMSDVKIPTLITFIAYWVIGLPAAYALMQWGDLGLEGIWYGLTAGLAFSSVFMTLRFEWKSRRPI